MVMHSLDSILFGLQQDRRTGTLMCVGEGNILGRAYFENGIATTARYQSAQGQEALQKIREMSFVSAKFHENVDFVRSQVRIVNSTSPPPSVMFQLPKSERASEQNLDNVLVITELALDSRASKSMEVSLSPILKDILTEELSEHLGPIAFMLVNELDDHTSLKNAVNLLAAEIGNTDAAIDFATAVHKRIR